MSDFNNYQWNKDDYEPVVRRQEPAHEPDPELTQKSETNTYNQAYNQTYSQPYYTENFTEKKTNKKKIPLNYVTVAIVSSLIGGLIFGTTFAFVSPMVNNSSIMKEFKSSFSDDKQAGATGNISDVASSNSKGEPLSVVDIAKKAGPAVVGIVNKVETRSFIRQTVEQGSGSGIILNKDGYIVTNNHVVDGASDVTVVLNTGKEYTAKLVGRDAKTDLAIIKIDAPDLIPADLGDSAKLEVGEMAVAIGNPLGQELAGSVTVGVISALNRSIKIEDREMTLIQTDAAINPGNSGGALVDSYGKIVGINTVKMAAAGVEGLGFSIPINEAKPIIDDLINSGYVKGRPLIGIAGRDITEEVARRYSLPVGIYVVQITPFSGAEKAGIQPQDVIVKVNGKAVKTMQELNAIKEKHKAGDEIDIEVKRDGETKNFKVKLTEEKPDEQQP